MEFGFLLSEHKISLNVNQEIHELEVAGFLSEPEYLAMADLSKHHVVLAHMLCTGRLTVSPGDVWEEFRLWLVDECVKFDDIFSLSGEQLYRLPSGFTLTISGKNIPWRVLGAYLSKIIVSSFMPEKIKPALRSPMNTMVTLGDVVHNKV